VRSAYLCVLCVNGSFNAENAKIRRGPQRKPLRTPESAVERGLADRVALARTRFTGRAAVTTDPGIAVLIAIDIAARAGGELRPAALEGPIGWWRSRLCHARSEEKNKENYGSGRELNSAQSHHTHLLLIRLRSTGGKRPAIRSGESSPVRSGHAGVLTVGSVGEYLFK